MTQIADEYKSAQTAFAEALANVFGIDPEDICAVLNQDPVALALDDLHAAWLQFSDEQDFGAEVATQDLLDAMADEAGRDADTAADDADFEERQRMEEERAKTGEKGPAKLTKSIAVPVKMTSAADIDALIQQLHEIKAQLALYAEIEVTFVTTTKEQQP